VVPVAGAAVVVSVSTDGVLTKAFLR